MSFGSQQIARDGTREILAALMRRPLSPLAVSGVAQHADRAGQLSSGDLVVALRGAREALLRLADTSRALDADAPNSLFSAALVRSSEPAAVRARVLPGADLGQLPADAHWRIDVSALAVAQQNAGATLATAAGAALAPGSHTVRVAQQGVTTDVTFSVEAGDSNGEALDRFAAALNGTAGLGVVASVVTDARGGTSRLVVSARDTGASQAFTLSDVTGTAVAAAGVGTATTAAASARYTLDGAVLTSETNSILLGTDGGIHVTLAAVTSDAADVSVTPDASRIGAAVTALVRSYNAARRFFDDHADLFAGTAAALRALGSRFRAALGSVGVTPDTTGTLAVDQRELQTALTQSLAVVREAVGGGRGVATGLRALAERQLATAGGGLDPLPAIAARYAPRSWGALSGGAHWPPQLFDSRV